MIDVAGNVVAVRVRMARAAERAGRDPGGVRLIAAAKTKGAEFVAAAIAAGVTDIGENYVQEAEAKRAQVQGPACWHLIGHLQRNKAARAAEVFDVIHGIDRLDLGAALSRHGVARGRPVRVLVEVNLAGEATKHGVAPAQAIELVAQLHTLPQLTVEGLMAVPPPAAAEATRPLFRHLRALRDELGLAELSMGMSDDFEVAIEEGATMVRIGRAIFGAR